MTKSSSRPIRSPYLIAFAPESPTCALRHSPPGSTTPRIGISTSSATPDTTRPIAAAMSAGIEAARGDVIVPMDGDLQNDPADIGKLLGQLDAGSDVVSGWRRDRKDREFGRKLPSRIANRLISTISGVRLHDYGCSLKAYRRDVLRDVKLYGEMHRFIPIYASWQGARVSEMVVNLRFRRACR